MPLPSSFSPRASAPGLGGLLGLFGIVVVACTSSSSSGDAADGGAATLDASGGGGGDGGGGTGTDSGGGTGTNACGKTGGPSYYAATLGNGTLLYKLQPDADTDTAVGGPVAVGGAPLAATDFLVDGTDLLLLVGDTFYRGTMPAEPLPKLPGKIECTKVTVPAMPTLRFMGGTKDTVFGVQGATGIYKIEILNDTVTPLGAAVIPPECTLVDFSEKPQPVSVSFSFLANCGTAPTNRVFTIETSGGSATLTATKAIEGITEPLISAHDGRYFTPAASYLAQVKGRTHQECGPSAPNKFQVTRVNE